MLQQVTTLYRGSFRKEEKERNNQSRTDMWSYVQKYWFRLLFLITRENSHSYINSQGNQHFEQEGLKYVAIHNSNVQTWFKPV